MKIDLDLARAETRRAIAEGHELLVFASYLDCRREGCSPNQPCQMCVIYLDELSKMAPEKLP